MSEIIPRSPEDLSLPQEAEKLRWVEFRGEGPDKVAVFTIDGKEAKVFTRQELQEYVRNLKEWSDARGTAKLNPDLYRALEKVLIAWAQDEEPDFRTSEEKEEYK